MTINGVKQRVAVQMNYPPLPKQAEDINKTTHKKRARKQVFKSQGTIIIVIIPSNNKRPKHNEKELWVSQDIEQQPADLESINQVKV